MNHTKQGRGGASPLPFYSEEKVELAKCWFRLLSLVEQHLQMDHLDKDTLLHVQAWMDMLMNRKPVPRHLHDPDEISSRHFLQADADISTEAIALAFYQASQSHLQIDWKGRGEV